MGPTLFLCLRSNVSFESFIDASKNGRTAATRRASRWPAPVAQKKKTPPAFKLRRRLGFPAVGFLWKTPELAPARMFTDPVLGNGPLDRAVVGASRRKSNPHAAILRLPSPASSGGAVPALSRFLLPAATVRQDFLQDCHGRHAENLPAARCHWRLANSFAPSSIAVPAPMACSVAYFPLVPVYRLPGQTDGHGLPDVPSAAGLAIIRAGFGRIS